MKKTANYIIPQIAALYLGCEVETPDGRGILSAVSIDSGYTVTFGADGPDFDRVFLPEGIKPILRPMSDMDGREVCKMPLRPGIDRTFWLFKNRFDALGLIPAGLAVKKMEQ